MSQEPTSALFEVIQRHGLEGQNLRRISAQAFEELRSTAITDEDLLRCCEKLDQFAVVEAMRRLRVSMHQLDAAATRLFWVGLLVTGVIGVAEIIVPLVSGPR